MVAKGGEEKEKEEKEKRVKKLAWVWDAELAKEDGGLHKSRQELKKRKWIQEKEEVKVVYLKRLFVKQKVVSLNPLQITSFGNQIL